MSFLQDIVVDNVDSASARDVIDRTMVLLNISEDRAFFLLMEYEWNEEKIAANRASLTRAAVVVNRSTLSKTIGVPAMFYSFCERCNSLGNARSVRLDCGFILCSTCWDAYVQQQFAADTVLFTCPCTLCPDFMNPSTLTRNLTMEQNELYTRLLMTHYVTNKRRHEQYRHMKLFFVSVLAVSAVVGISKASVWPENHPTATKAMSIYCKQVAGGGLPKNPFFWVKLFLKTMIG